MTVGFSVGQNRLLKIEVVISTEDDADDGDNNGDDGSVNGCILRHDLRQRNSSSEFCLIDSVTGYSNP